MPIIGIQFDSYASKHFNVSFLVDLEYFLVMGNYFTCLFITETRHECSDKVSEELFEDFVSFAKDSAVGMFSYEAGSFENPWRPPWWIM